MKWRELLTDVEVTEVVPIDVFEDALLKYLKPAPKEVVTEIDLTGLDVLTDEPLVVLSECFEGTPSSRTVKSINFTGCVHITDYGVIQLAKVFSQLEKVTLDGCCHVSEVSVNHLVRSCKNLSDISLCGTNVAFTPLVEDREINFTLHGCPVIPQGTEGSGDGADGLPVKKLVVLSKRKCPYSLLHFLSRNLSTKKAVEKRKDEGKASLTLSYEAEKRLSYLEYSLNVLELYCKPVFYSPFLSDEAVFVMVVEKNNMSNIHYHIMTHLNVIRGSVHFAELLVVIYHEDNEKEAAEIAEIGAQLLDFMQQQHKVLTRHIRVEKHSYQMPGEPMSQYADRDFATQERYCRSKRVLSTQSFELKVFGVNKDTSEVLLIFPPPKGGGGTDKLDENDSVYQELMTIISTKFEPAVRRLQTLNKSDLTELKSFSNPPRLVLKALSAMNVLFQAKENWGEIKKMISNYQLIPNMISFDKDNISPTVLKNLEKYINDQELSVEQVDKVSRGAAAIYAWVESVYHYGNAAIALKERIEDQKHDVDFDSDSEEDLDPSIPVVKEFLDVKEKWLQGHSKGWLTKADMNELFQMKSPPSAIKNAVDAVCILMGQKNDFGEALKLMKAREFFPSLENYDKENIPPDRIKKLEKHFQNNEMNIEVLKGASAVAGALGVWVNTVYQYNKAWKALQEFKENVVRKAKKTGRQPRRSKGPKALLCAINAAFKKQETSCVFYANPPAEVLNYVQQVYNFLASLKHKKIVQEEEIFTALESSDQFSALDRRSVVRIIEELHRKGSLIRIKTGSAEALVVLDIEWFMNLMPPLQHLSNSEEIHNRGRHKAIPPNTPICTADTLAEVLGEMCTPEQYKLVVRCLLDFGVLLLAPSRSVERQVSNWGSYILFSHLHDRVLLQQEPGSAEGEGGIFKHLWPEVNTELGTSDTDYRIDYRYQFTAGIPPSFIPRLFGECCVMGTVIALWRWGVLVRVGAAEILIKHNIYSLLLSSNIDVEARVTRWGDPGIDGDRVQEYLWGAVSPYLLLIESLIHNHARTHCKLRLPCRGAGCNASGVFRKFSPARFSKELDWVIPCADCKGESMSLEDSKLYTGKQRSLPFHDHQENTGLSINNVAPYSALTQSKVTSGDLDLLWTCRHCGISHVASQKLWDLESTLFPSPVCSIILPIWSRLEGISIEGSVVSAKMTKPTNDSSDEVKKKKKAAFMMMRSRLMRTGQLDLKITVLKPGPTKIIIGTETFFDSFEGDDDCKESDFWFDLSQGVIEKVILSETTDHDARKIREENENWKCNRGDVITVRCDGEKWFDYGNGTKKMGIGLRILRNSKLITEVSVLRFRRHIALSLEAERDREPSVIVQAHKFPMVRAHHFELGSLLLMKSIGNQWDIARVLAIKNGFIYVGHSKEDLKNNKMQRFHTTSTDIRPLGNYSTEFPIVSVKGGKREILQYKSEMMKHIHATHANIAPMALFVLPGLSFQPLTLGKKLSLGKFCSTNWNCPSAINEAHRKFMNTEGKSQKSKNDIWFALLPNQLLNRDLLNPGRQRQQNWQQQDLHLVCKGNEWNITTSYMRDVHFMNLAPVTINKKQGFTLTESLLTCVLNAYSLLDRGKSILPQTRLMFPNLVAEFSEEEILEGMWQFISLYLNTFLLMERALIKVSKPNAALLRELAYAPGMKCGLYRIPLKSSYKAKVVVNQLEKPDAVGAASGKCFTHGIPLGDFIQSLLSTNPEKEEEKVILEEYVNCLTHITTTRSAIRERMARLLDMLPHLEALSLFKCSILSLEGVESCKYMTHLILTGNQISVIPEGFESLKDTLQTLDLSQNKISNLPGFITKFQRLKSLSIKGSTIRELPEDIGNMKNLVVLNLKHSLISDLPDSIKNLKNLEVLVLEGVPYIAKHGLLDLSGDLVLRREKLAQLNLMKTSAYKSLSVEEMEGMFDSVDTGKKGVLLEDGIDQLNQMLFDRFPRIGKTAADGESGFPSQILSLSKLRVLSLGYQAVRVIPEEIKKLNRLEIVILQHSLYLHSLGNGIGMCPLKVLNLDGCGMLKTPPREIREQGMKVVISYVKRLAQGSMACYRTKLMFLGLGGAGKTSLMRAVMSSDMKAPHIKGEGITDGIDISNWSVNRGGTTVTYSVWDFAGQTIYYNTHQFFLSGRAVYLLVWNTRLGYEHSGLDFWLSSISCHCPKVPIFVVGTHADQITNPELPEDDLRLRYPNIYGFFTVSSLEGMGIRELLESLLKVTLEQPYMGEMIPEAWLNLEKYVLSKRREKSLIEFSTLKKLGEDSGIYSQELNQAVQFLHDLGTLQHFNNELLKDRVVINPQWIVDVMACVVSVHNTAITNGYLKHSDIGAIWGNYPKELHNWMLRLTEVFDLTFPLSDRPENVVPCLLTQTIPKFDWPAIEEQDGARESKMVYTFDYLPTGLFNRAQVRLYQYSESSALWKNGSLLKKNNHCALIQQTGGRELTVLVYGQQPENILLLIHEVFESLITESFSGVKYEYQLPCLDCVKASEAEPAMFSSSVLRRALSLKALFLQCHTAFHTLSIRDVQSVMPPQSVSDYDIQLLTAVQNLEELQDEISNDAAFLYCPANTPSDPSPDIIHPKQIVDDLKNLGFRCWYDEKLADMSMEDIAVALKSSKVVCVFISDDFVKDEHCKRMFHFVKASIHKDILLAMVGSGREWMKSDIGMQMSHKVFVNFQRVLHYKEKFSELTSQLQAKTKKDLKGSHDNFDMFLSYCWSNSEEAVKAGTRPKPGSVGQGDPRKIKQFLETKGLKCWIDVDNAGKGGLFEDIAQGMKRSKVIVACVSDEYAVSPNCQMEFRFAHVALRKPIILAVVGTGYKWESTEVGMLSLGYRKINFQLATEQAFDELVETVNEHCPADASGKEIAAQAKSDEKEKAFQELFEMAQRKFLRQVSGFVEHKEPFPRLFIGDFSYDPSEKNKEESERRPSCDVVEEVHVSNEAKNDTATEEISDDRAGNKLTFVADELRAGQFCIKILCEYEGGWHCVDEGVAVDIGGPDLATLWDCAAPYMSRILAILKHSSLDLHILKTPEGKKLISYVEERAGMGGASQLSQIYMLIRQYVCAKDTKSRTGNLKRCYIPSGKVLWLCEEHQAMPRITVLDNTDDDVDDNDVNGENPERVLLKGLMKLSLSGRDPEEKEGSTVSSSKPTDKRLADTPAPQGILKKSQEPASDKEEIIQTNIKEDSKVQKVSFDTTSAEQQADDTKVDKEPLAIVQDETESKSRAKGKKKAVRILSAQEKEKLIKRISTEALVRSAADEFMVKPGATSRACVIL